MTGSKEGMKEEYSKYTYRKILFIIACIVATAMMFFVSLCVGTLDLSANEAITYFVNHLKGITYTDEDQIFADRIIWKYRVPRALFAIIAGLALSVAGAIMQSVMKNPLADPYTTGVSSGALFGAAIAMVLGCTIAGGIGNDLAIVINAIIFALIPILVIVIMAPFFRKSPSTLILSGVAVSYLFNSFTSLLLVTTDSATLTMVYRWQVGSLIDLSWDALPLTTIFTVAGLAIVLPLSGKLNIMALDDKDAKALGLNIERLRIVCLVILALMTSVIISYVGIIGFVGLVIPHIVRMVLGADNKYLLPAAGAFGAAFLLGCDILSRALDVGASIPVGVITSFIGAPLFLYLIIRQRRNMW